jgi:DNA-binding MarR family transcriptional regulator
MSPRTDAPAGEPTRQAERATPDAVDPALDPFAQLGRSFKGAMAAVRRLRGRETRRQPGELSDAQYGLLFSLRDQAAMSSSELAFAADLSPASATEMLDGLVATRLVCRERSDRDRRVVLISLTDRGRKLIEERRARYEPRWRATLSEFSDDELRTASAVLDRMRDMFDELRHDEG